MTPEQSDEIIAIATSWVQPLGQEGNPTPEQIQARLDAEAKQAKLEALANLTVTTSAGNTFDADDAGRASIHESLRSIETTQSVLNSLSTDIERDTYITNNSLLLFLKIDAIYKITHTLWNLADNSKVYVTNAELEEALALGIQAKGAIILGM